MSKLTRDERAELCEHDDEGIEAYLTAVENGRIGIIHDSGRGSHTKPRLDGTLRSYSQTLATLWRELGSPVWQGVTERQLEDFLHRPVGEDGRLRSMTTGIQQLSCIKNFFKYMVAYKLVSYDRPDDNPTAFVRLDPERLARAVERLPVSDEDWLAVVGCPRLGTDNLLWLGLGYYVGLRREEIVTLAPHAIDPIRQRILFVDRKGAKTKTNLEYGELVEFLIDRRPEVADGAREWAECVGWYAKRRQGETTLVPDSDAKHVGQRLSDQLEHHVLPDAGLDRHAFTVHQLRHSFGTNMALAGMPMEDIADLMSHSSTDTTRRYRDMAGQVASLRKRLTEPTPEQIRGGLRSVNTGRSGNGAY